MYLNWTDKFWNQNAFVTTWKKKYSSVKVVFLLWIQILNKNDFGNGKKEINEIE